MALTSVSVLCAEPSPAWFAMSSEKRAGAADKIHENGLQVFSKYGRGYGKHRLLVRKSK
jgi:hypothetical protein